MGLLTKYITTKLTESVIKTVGKVTLDTTVGIMEKQQHKTNSASDNATKKPTHKKTDILKIKAPNIENGGKNKKTKRNFFP